MPASARLMAGCSANAARLRSDIERGLLFPALSVGGNRHTFGLPAAHDPSDMKSPAARKQEFTAPEMFLRIKHPTLTPEAITEAIGIEPEHTVCAGRVASRSGVQRLHSECYWLGRLPRRTVREMLLGVRTSSAPNALPRFSKEMLMAMRDATDFDNCIHDALLPLIDKIPFLHQLKREGSISLLIQRTDRTEPLTLHASLQRLAELGITLEVD
jgi:hypothetical protein